MRVTKKVVLFYYKRQDLQLVFLEFFYICYYWYNYATHSSDFI